MANNIIDPKDFQYEEKDIVLVRNALHDIRESERTALQLGFLGYIASYGIVYKKAFWPKGVQHFAGLLTGALVYNSWLYTARRDYERISGDLNYKTSVYLNKFLF